MKILCALLLTAMLCPAQDKEKRPEKPPPPLVPPVLPVMDSPGPNGPWVVDVKLKGDYSQAASYGIHEMVRHDGKYYVSMTDQNQGNQPGPASSVWTLLPDHGGQAPTKAAWGMLKDPPGPVEFTREHFATARSYTCSTPAGKGNFRYLSGEKFTVTDATASGYVCAGE